jgi:uncharacterized protein YuzE
MTEQADGDTPETVDPDGREVMLTAAPAATWSKVGVDRLEHVELILSAVSVPDHREMTNVPAVSASNDRTCSTPAAGLRGRRLQRRLSLDRDRTRARQRPAKDAAMSVTIAGIGFANHDYDERGDVLYLSVEGYEGPPATAYGSPEGHNVEYDDAGRVIAMTLVNVRWLLERDGELTITWPAGYVKADELAGVLLPAA